MRSHVTGGEARKGSILRSGRIGTASPKLDPPGVGGKVPGLRFNPVDIKRVAQLLPSPERERARGTSALPSAALIRLHRIADFEFRRTAPSRSSLRLADLAYGNSSAKAIGVFHP